MRRLLVATIVFLASVGPFACNIFRSLDRCGDCAPGFECDPEGRFCIDRRVVTDAPSEADASDDAVQDVISEPDAEPPCPLSNPFGPATLVAGFEDRSVTSARFWPDENRMYFSALHGCNDAATCTDLLVAKRDDSSSPFEFIGALDGMNSARSEYWPSWKGNGLVIFFESDRSLQPGAQTRDHARIWSTYRRSLEEAFPPPVVQSVFILQGIEGSPYLHPTANRVYFMSLARSDGGGLDLFAANIDYAGAASTVKPLANVNTKKSELAPLVTFDDLVLYFAREIPPRDIYVSTRATPSDEFGVADPVSELNTRFEEYPSWVSDDQCRLYFISNRPRMGDGGAEDYRLWVASRTR